MSQILTRSQSMRKPIRPKIDFDDREDEQRRDVNGRKRVDVVHCLLDSSSDENEETKIFVENRNSIVWLNFNEISHIRSVLAENKLSQIKLIDVRIWKKLRDNRSCFRCYKTIERSFFFTRSRHTIRCSICKKVFCRNCVDTNSRIPIAGTFIPIRIENLIKSSSAPIDCRTKTDERNQTMEKMTCFDCFQLFNDRPRAFSLTPNSSRDSHQN